MLFVTVMRRAAGVAVLRATGRAIVFDPMPTRRRRSRIQHLRNGIGTLLLTSGVLAWRRTPTIPLYVVTQAVVRSELGYGLRELGRALAPPRDVAKRRMLALAVVPSIAAVVAIAAWARLRAGELPERPVTPPVPRVPANVAG
jgi:hypothetical protein